MKIRSDFVSNSSSSSYIVSISKDYLLKDFIKDLCKDTVANKDDGTSKEFIEKIKETNARNLNYHLNTSELLFLGTLRCEDKILSYYNKDVVIGNVTYNEYKDVIKYCKDTDEETVIEKDEDHVIVAEKQFRSGLVVSHDMMEYEFGRYDFIEKDKKLLPQEKSKIVRSIMKFANAHDIYGSSAYHFNPELYMITMNTIDNTRVLMELGCDISFEKYERLDEFEELLKNGNKIFGIRVNQGGDGIDCRSIYALGGWSAVIGNYAKCDIIASFE